MRGHSICIYVKKMDSYLRQIFCAKSVITYGTLFNVPEMIPSYHSLCMGPDLITSKKVQ